MLYQAFTTGGIHGRNDMPEDVRPGGVERGSLEHVLFITLTTAIDYQSEAGVLWENTSPKVVRSAAFSPGAMS